MKVKELIQALEEFQERLTEHQKLWGKSLSQPIPEYPVSNIDTLEGQSRWLCRKLGALRPYILRFDNSWIMAHQATGTQWNVLNSAVSLTDIAQVKGPSMPAAIEKLDQIIGRLQTMPQEDDIPEDTSEQIRKINTAKLNAKKLLISDNATLAMDVGHIWAPDKLRCFISHRDSKKREAKVLANSLEDLGVTCFVAHDSIVPMTTWKEEIYKALNTMEAFVCFITEDYYKSEWTNQEIGFALAKGVPIFLYSADNTDPKGFNMDIQAIKSGEKTLANCLKKGFFNHPAIKMTCLNAFLDAKNGSFSNAKKCFCEIIGFKFSDEEIDEIVKTINGPAKYSNQLRCLLCDWVSEDEARIAGVPPKTPYTDLLEKHVLSQHSFGRYKIEKVDEISYRLVDSLPKVEG